MFFISNNVLSLKTFFFRHRDCSFDKPAIYFLARDRKNFVQSERIKQKLTIFSWRKLATNHLWARKMDLWKSNQGFPYQIWNVFTQSPSIKSKKNHEIYFPLTIRVQTKNAVLKAKLIGFYNKSKILGSNAAKTIV